MKLSVYILCGFMMFVFTACGTTSASLNINTAPSQQSQQQAQSSQKNQTEAPKPQPQPAGVITFDQGGPLPKGVQPPVDTYLKPGEVFVPGYAPDRFEGNWGIGKIITPASEKTKGEAEAVQFYDNKPIWISANFIITKSRPATAEELHEGMLVLCGKIDEYGRRSYDTWFLGVIKSMEYLYKGEILMERYPHDALPKQFQWKLNLIRIIEEPTLRFKKVGNNYMKLP
jgi:hypothetical protein